MRAADVGGGRWLTWDPDRPPVCTGMLRRGRPRGAEVAVMTGEPRRELLAMVRRVDHLDADGRWYETGAELRVWARAKGAWGAIDGAPFDRRVVRRALAEFRWPVGPRWATFPEPGGRVLVLRGRAGRRLLIMSGVPEVVMRECVGRALVDGRRS